MKEKKERKIQLDGKFIYSSNQNTYTFTYVVQKETVEYRQIEEYCRGSDSVTSFTRLLSNVIGYEWCDTIGNIKM